MFDPAFDEEDENLTALLNRVSSSSTPAEAAQSMRQPLSVSRTGTAPDTQTPDFRVAPGDRSAAQRSDSRTQLLGDISNAGTSVLEGLTLTKLPRTQVQPNAEARMVAEADAAQKNAKDARMMALRELEIESRANKPAKQVDPVEAEAKRMRAEAAKSNAETYATRTKNDADIARERLAAQKAKDAARAAAAKAKAAAKAGAPTQGLAAGYELTGETKPVTTELTKHQNLVASAEKMKGLTRQMRDALAGASTLDRLNPVGEKRNAIKQLATMIAIEGKNIAELGALSGPDYALMNSIAADPTSVASLTKDLPSLLNQLDAWGDNSVAAKSKALGVRPKAAAGPTQPPAVGGRTVVRTGVNKKTGKRVVQYSDGTTEEQ